MGPPAQRERPHAGSPRVLSPSLRASRLGTGLLTIGAFRYLGDAGECFLIVEGGSPQKIKTAYLTDADIKYVADQAAVIRGVSPFGDIA